MNVHTRTQVAAVIAVMFLLNFYYFKSWNRSSKSSEAHSAGSNNQFHLIKLTAASNQINYTCNQLMAPWGSVYYVIDNTTGVALVFAQNSSTQEAINSQQELDVSFVQMDPQGFVNSEKHARLNSSSNSFCMSPLTKTKKKNENGARHLLLQEIEILIMRIIKANTPLKTPHSVHPYNKWRHMLKFFVMKSNCIQNVIDIFKDNHIEVIEQNLECSNNVTQYLLLIMKTVMESDLNNLKPAITVENMIELYYSSPTATEPASVDFKMLFPQNTASDLKDNKKSEIKIETDADFTKYHNNSKHSLQNSNLTKLIEPLKTTVKSIHITNESKDFFIKKSNGIYSSQNLSETKSSPVNQSIESLTKNKDIERVNLEIAQNNTKINERLNTTDLDQQDTFPKNLNKTFSDPMNVTASKSENNEQYSKTDIKEDKKRKQKLAIKTNGLNTILVFKNLGEINDLYDKTFSEPEFLTTSLASSPRTMELSKPKDPDGASINVSPIPRLISNQKQHFTSDNTLQKNSNPLVPSEFSNIGHIKKSNNSIRRLKHKNLTHKVVLDDIYERQTEKSGIHKSLRIPYESARSLLREAKLDDGNDLLDFSNMDDMHSLVTESYPKVNHMTETMTEAVQLHSPISLKNALEVIMKRVNITQNEPGKLRAMPLLSSDNLVKSEEGDIRFISTSQESSEKKSPFREQHHHAKTETLLVQDDNINGNSRNFATKLNPMKTDSNTTKHYEHTELSKKTKFINQMDIVHKTQDLYDREPQHGTFKTHKSNDYYMAFNNEPNKSKNYETGKLYFSNNEQRPSKSLDDQETLKYQHSRDPQNKEEIFETNKFGPSFHREINKNQQFSMQAIKHTFNDPIKINENQDLNISKAKKGRKMLFKTFQTHSPKSHSFDDFQTKLKQNLNMFNSDSGKINYENILKYHNIPSARNRYPNELPTFSDDYLSPLTNVSYNSETHVPEVGFNEYGSGEVKTPHNIKTYNPDHLNPSNFNSTSAENVYNENPHGEYSPYYNEYPEETPVYLHQSDNTTLAQSPYSNPNNEYSGYYENTKNDHSDFSIPTEPVTPGDISHSTPTFGYNEKPQVTKSEYNNPYHFGGAVMTRNPQTPHSTDYDDSTEVPKDYYSYGIGPNIPESPQPPSMPPNDGTYSTEHYDTYDDNGSANVNAGVANGQVSNDYTSTEIIHSTGNPIPNSDSSNYVDSGEVNNTTARYPNNVIYNDITNTEPIRHEHNTLNKINSANIAPFVPDDFNYHKNVKPTTYKTSQNFKNKFPPDKQMQEFFENNDNPYPHLLSTGMSLLEHGNPSENYGPNHQSKPLIDYFENNVAFERPSFPSNEIVEQFLNSPIEFNDSEKPLIFELSSFNNKNKTDDFKHFFHQTLLNGLRNETSIDVVQNLRAVNNSNIQHLLGNPNFVQSVRLGDNNTFQPVISEKYPSFETTRSPPIPLLNYNMGNIILNTDHMKHMRPFESFLSNFNNADNVSNNPKTVRPAHMLTLWKKEKPQIDLTLPVTSHNGNYFKGIDIFIPRKNHNFRSIGKNIDILTPSSKSPIVNLIKVKPVHTAPPVVQQIANSDRSLEIEIITDPKVEEHDLFTTEYTYEQRLENPQFVKFPLDSARSGAQTSSFAIDPTPSIERGYSQYGGSQSLNETTSRPLSRRVGHVLPSANPDTLTKGKRTHGNRTLSKPHSGETLKESTPMDSFKFMNIPNSTQISFEKFNTEQEINSYLKHIGRIYGHKVNVSTIGHSVEGRSIQVVKISHNQGGKNPTILLDGGIHAREWIAPATVLYVIQQLVEHPGNFPMMKNVDWLLVPLLNPDGYEYSMTKDRLWRKNRARPKSSDTKQCYGVDLNRNFGVFRRRRHLADSEPRGASDDPCASNYHGAAPFSEPESRALRDLVLQYRDLIKLYVSFHSYGNFFMYPWSYKRTLPNDWKDLDGLATAARGAILNITGTHYAIGSTADIMGMNSGGSDDWVKGYVGVKYCYTVELPGGGAHGFDLPPNQIQKVVSDMFEGIKVLGRYVEREFVT